MHTKSMYIYVCIPYDTNVHMGCMYSYLYICLPVRHQIKLNKRGPLLSQ